MRTVIKSGCKQCHKSQVEQIKDEIKKGSPCKIHVFVSIVRGTHDDDKSGRGFGIIRIDFM